MKMDGNTIVYEIGDPVTCVDNLGAPANYRVGETSKVSYANEEMLRTESNPNTNMLLKRFRIATQEEINKATQEEKIMVSEYEVEFWFYNSEIQNKIYDYIKICSVTINKEKALKIMKKAGWL